MNLQNFLKCGHSHFTNPPFPPVRSCLHLADPPLPLDADILYGWPLAKWP